MGVTGQVAWARPGSGLWAAGLRSVRHDAYHLPGYVAMQARSMDGTAAGFVYREQEAVFFLPVVLRQVPGTEHVDAVSPYGYPGPVSNISPDDTDFWRRASRAFVDALRDKGAITCFVRLNPLLNVPDLVLAEHGTVVQHGCTVAVDLTLGLDQIWSQTRANHRRQINRARRQGMRLVIDDWSRVETFVDIYHETMRRVGADDYYFFDAAHMEGLRSAMGHHVHLVLVEVDGDACAGGVFFERDAIVQYHLGATRTSALPMQPTKLMFADMEVWAKDRGNAVLHLGGGVGGEDNPLFHFKAGFSPWNPSFGTWRIVVDEHAYGEVAGAQAAGEIGDSTEAGDRSGYFPAYRAPSG
jgi:hypothetical protein